jgi:hypothetical protein
MMLRDTKLWGKNIVSAMDSVNSKGLEAFYLLKSAHNQNRETSFQLGKFTSCRYKRYKNYV